MVILNEINFLLLRFPLAIIDLHSLIFRLDIEYHIYYVTKNITI